MADQPKPRIIRVRDLSLARVLRASCDHCGARFDEEIEGLTTEDVARVYKVPFRIFFNEKEAWEIPDYIELIVCVACIKRHGRPLAVAQTWRFKEQSIIWAKVRPARTGSGNAN